MTSEMRRGGRLIPLVLLALLPVGCGGGGGGAEEELSPTLTSVSPDSAFQTAAAIVTLTGSGFLDNAPGTTSVRVGSTPATNVVVLSDTEISCRIPAAPGTFASVDVVVTNDNGSARLFDGFTYYTDPPLFRSTDQPISEDDPGMARSEYVKLCCTGEHVYAAWEDRRNGAADVYFNQSADGGRTWQTFDRRLDTDMAGAAASYDIGICCDGSSVYVIWHDERNGGSDLYLNRSTDGGVTWLTSDRRINDAAGLSFKSTSSICCEGAALYVAWNDNRNGQNDIYFNRSSDGGLSWQPADRRICTDTAGATRSGGPHLSCDNGRLAIVWTDARDDPDSDAVYFNGSSDAGATWLGADVRVDHDLLDAGDAGTPRVCHSTTGLCVVWRDDRNGARDIFANHSTDGGLTWRITDERLDSDWDPAVATRSSSLDLCCAGSIVGVVWADSGSDKGEGVRFSRSVNGGSSFLPKDFRVSRVTPGSSVLRPQICCEREQMFVVWAESRDGDPRDIYFNRSLDTGNTWLATDLRLDSEGAGPADSSSPSICCEGARLHFAWHDERDGAPDIYYQSTVPE